jgi:hypothetical protein
MNKKQPVYIAPAIEIIPIASGSVMASSITTSSIDAPSSTGGGTYSRNPYSVSPAATPMALDDMINDILTVGQ